MKLPPPRVELVSPELLAASARNARQLDVVCSLAVAAARGGISGPDRRGQRREERHEEEREEHEGKEEEEATAEETQWGEDATDGEPAWPPAAARAWPCAGCEDAFGRATHVRSCDDVFFELPPLRTRGAAAEILGAVQAAVRAATGCSVSLAAAPSRICARLRTAQIKPEGVGVIWDAAAEVGTNYKVQLYNLYNLQLQIREI